MDLGRLDPQRLWATYGVKLMRYGGVTVVTTVVGLTVFIIGLEVFGWPRVPANLVSVMSSTPFAYILNRQYVWERTPGSHSVAREVGPFWILTFIGFGFSTFVVWVVGLVSEATLVLLAAQVAAFGTLWLVKFAFLEKYLWKANDEAVPAAERV